MITLGGVPMLISFSLKNTYSFRDEATLSMEASSIRAHSYSLLEANEKKYLPVAAIYGANASGKTNLLRALSYTLGTIANDKHERVLSFMLSEKIPSRYSELKLKFCVDDHIFDYRLKCVLGDIFEEQLLCAPPHKKQLKSLFLRKWGIQEKKWTLCNASNLLGSDALEEINYVSSMAINPDELVLSAMGKRGKLSIFSSIFQWAQHAVTYRHRSTSSMGVPFYSSNSEMVQLLSNQPEENSEKKAFLHFVQTVNPMISDANLGKVDLKKPDQYSLTWDYKLRPKGLEDESIRTDELISIFESRGVYLAADLFLPLHHVLQHGGLLIVDELETSLHPLLMAKVISMFTDPDTNPGKGQLIFTTHNALLMDKKYFRQDEIVFVEKDEAGCSSLYRLSDIEGVRSDRDFCKSYICGAFGAIPEWSDEGANGDG